MPSNESDGEEASGAKTPQGAFELPSWLEEIDLEGEFVSSPARGIWTFQPRPFGQDLRRWSWRALVFAICSIGVVATLVIFVGLAPLATKYVPPILLGSVDLRLFAGAIPALIVLYYSLRLARIPWRRVIQHRSPSRNPKGFFVRVDFDKGDMTWATKFANSPIPTPKREESYEIQSHPSTVQNALPRLYSLQRMGRIRLRFDGSRQIYVFECRRWLPKDLIAMASGFAPTIMTVILFIDALLRPDVLGLTILSFVLLIWAVVVLTVLRQRWKANGSGVAVVFAQNKTAKLAWNQCLGVRKGFHSVAILLDNVTALNAFCARLSELHKVGEQFWMTREP